jgi:Holliday junction resolvasome RuvABC endonuclease subunit
MSIFIGIDLSLNSTGICIIREDGNKIVSIFKTENNIEKIFTRDDHFSLLNNCGEVNIILEPKSKQEEAEYHIRERSKISSFIRLTDLIINSIKNEIGEETYIAMEGISFGSTGNSLIDISMATGILRKELIERLGGNTDKFFVFSPTAIKKFAGKGNFKKIDMFDAIIKESDLNSEFINILRNNREMCVTPKGIVKKPIEDMIDSFWVARFLKSVVLNGK